MGGLSEQAACWEVEQEEHCSIRASNEVERQTQDTSTGGFFPVREMVEAGELGDEIPICDI